MMVGAETGEVLMGKLTDKVAVVTGASKGIGAAITKAFAAEGAAVVVSYAASRADAERVVADIAAQGGKAVAVQADVAKSGDVERLFANARSSFGQIDILVNNAGIYRFAPIEGVSEDDFHQHFNINVLGVLLATKQALKHFGPNGGSIINFSTAVTRNPCMPRHLCLYRLEERRRGHYADAGKGARAAQDQGERHQPR